jgi:hypothetical protein
MTEPVDVICQVRESFSGLRMDMPVEEVFARSRARRRRRLSGLTAAGAATAGAAVAVTLALAGPAGAGRPGNSPSASPSAVRLAEFTVTSGPGDSVTLVLQKGQQLDASALRAALARHGIAALVTVGTFCRSTPAASGGSGLFKNPSSQPYGGDAMVIDGSALPPGTELSIGYSASWVKMGVVEVGAPLSCGSPLGQQAVRITPPGTPAHGQG